MSTYSDVDAGVTSVGRRSVEITDFLFPGRLIARSGAARDLPSILSSSGTTGPVFLVADPVVRALGIVDPIVDDLVAAGHPTTVFDRITGEPQAVDVQAGVSLARSSAAAVIIGIGGGSALDSAKMIALGTVLERPIGEIFGKVDHVAGFPQLILLPTTTGTGSEATRIAMYGDEGRKRAISSAQFLPAVAVLDPELVSALPAAVVAATALDALSHAIESMMATTSNPLSDLAAGEAARTIFANLATALRPDGQDARSALLYASFLGGVALNAGVVLGHSLSYVLAGQHQLSHGVGCALALPYCIAYNSSMDSERGAEIARAILQRPDADLQLLAAESRRLALESGLPVSLQELSTAMAPAPELAARLVEEYPRPTNPVPLTVGRLVALIGPMATGDLDAAWKAMSE